jgi:threonine dehydrogenase-like Zn-dependent dehydrogenase
VLKRTGGRGADHVIEVWIRNQYVSARCENFCQVGGMGTLEKSVNSARLGGWIHIIGFLATEV